MTQKLLIALAAVYLACSIASILKIAARKQLNVSITVLSLLMPLEFLYLMIKVNALFWEQDLKRFSFAKKVSLTFKFIMFQFQFAPSIHTIFIDGICRHLKENSGTRTAVIYFKTDEKTVSDVRGIIRPNVKFDWNFGR